jgi:energy-coupling factor transport system permease protein
MNRLALGQYIPGDSPVHSLDPRAKLLFAFSWMLMVLLADHAASYLFLLAFFAISIVLSRIPFSLFWSAARPAFFLIALTSVLHLTMTHGGRVLFQLPFWTLHEEGLRQAVFVSARLFLLMAMAALLTFTTSPVDLTDALEQLLRPFARWGLPAHELALMMSIALRFIPALWEEAEKIKKAQMARGADFESGNVWRRMQSYVPVLIPLFVSTFRRAEELAMAMEARGYRGGEGRTKWRRLRWSEQDTLLMAVMIILWLVLWLCEN